MKLCGEMVWFILMLVSSKNMSELWRPGLHHKEQ